MNEPTKTKDEIAKDTINAVFSKIKRLRKACTTLVDLKDKSVSGMIVDLQKQIDMLKTAAVKLFENELKNL